MSRPIVSNNAESTLTGAINTSATSITVQAGHGARFPTLTGGDWSMITLVKLVAGVPQNEIVKMTARASDVMTIVRAQEGTTALTFSAGDVVQVRVTAGVLNGKAELVGPAFVGSSNSGKTAMDGAATTLAASLVNAAEKVTITAAAATGTINLDVTTQSLLYYTLAATANWTINVRGNSSNSLNSLMAIGESVTVSMWATQGATAYLPSAYQVDGVAITPKWLGGAAPTVGNASSIDLYTLSIVKTANATFTLITSQGTAK